MWVRTQDYDKIYQYFRQQRDLGNEFVAYPNDGAAVLKPDLESFATQREAKDFCQAQSGYGRYDYIPSRTAYRAMSEAATDKSLVIKRYGYVDVRAMTEAYHKSLSAVSEFVTTKNKDINQDNLEYLQKQVMLTGFGDNHTTMLREKMEKSEKSFLLHHKQSYENDNLKATLSFSKSDKTDIYFFNKYTAELTKGNNPEPLRQTFYINKGEENITLKQAYNLLEGRPVHKQLTNKEGEQYTAWVQLNFKETDKGGNYQMQKFSAGYGFKLEKELAKHPIVQLNNPQDKERLIQSLERGNRQSVSFSQDGQEIKVFVEAAPQFKSLNFYDEHNKRLRPEQLYPQAKEAVNNDVKQEAKKDQKQEVSEEGGQLKNRTGRRE